MAGPWISVGIEFNWPQHHRPTTYMPVDHTIQENDDGSKTLFVNDVDQMYGTKGIAGFTLYPDKAYIEIRGQLYNRTAFPQTFLWWANPAVAVNDHTQWGNGEFGQAWDRNLTDEDGPYIELMTGVYTDNQADFTWLKPYEEKTFKQYFMPYKAVGYVKNATINAMVNLET